MKASPLTESASVALLLALTYAFSSVFVNYSIPPFEDAAMIMRYAEHLAAGHGIVWNIGEPPVDGATDFLFLLIVSGLHGLLNIEIEYVIRGVAFTAHYLTVGLIFLFMRKQQGAPLTASFFTALYFAIGPGLFYTAAYFGTPVFGLFIAASWMLAQRIIAQQGASTGLIIGYTLCCFTTGMIRPEGVLICIFMALTILVTVPLKNIKSLVITYIVAHLVLGAAYIAWRWSYFGHPLPNPFYKKGGGSLHMIGLQRSLENSLSFLYLAIPTYIYGLINSSTRRLAIGFGVTIGGTMAMWMLLSNEMNFGGRFQYPIFIMGILIWYPLVKPLFEKASASNLRPTKLTGVLVLVLIVATLGHRATISQKATYFPDGRLPTAKFLNQFEDKGYTVLTTEAGLIPFYSKWRAIDSWGLNDLWIAHNGIITPEYIAENSPDVALVNSIYFSPLFPPDKITWPTNKWHEHVMVLHNYMQTAGYTLAAAYGNRIQSAHYYWVKPGIEDHDAIVEGIRNIDYHWYEDGKKAKDFSAGLR